MARPNVIVILADDMGYGDFGVFSDGSARTPVLDQFVTESVCLTQHYSSAPVCTPARASLLTGRYPHRTGAIDMRELRGLSRLALREQTMGDLFKSAGYATGLIGKWHNGTIGRAYHPNRRGFDEFVGFRGGMSDYYDWRLYYNDKIHSCDGTYLTDVFAAEAAAFVSRHHAEPFFLHVAFNAPHTPLQAPGGEVTPFAETGKFTHAVATLYGMIHRLDTAIGQILDELERLGLTENTIVLFASDNGPQFGGVGDDCKDRFNGWLSGSKGRVYEGGIRVPGVIRWPAGIQGGRLLHEFAHFTDWLPTLLAAAGIERNPAVHLDGENILPWLRGEPYQGGDRRFWQWNRYTPLVTCNAAMRDGQWKLVRPAIQEAMIPGEAEMQRDRRVERDPEAYEDIIDEPEPQREVPPPPPPQLFNVDQDPHERHDLADIHPDRVARMLAELERWFADIEADRRSITD